MKKARQPQSLPSRLKNPERLIEIHEMEDPVRVKIENEVLQATRGSSQKADKLIYNAILLIIKSLTK